MAYHLWLVPLGFLVGACATLIGSGGGFMLVPLLLLLYPQATTETVTSISMAVVFMNALSGSWAYGRLGRIDYRSGPCLCSCDRSRGNPGSVDGELRPSPTLQYRFQCSTDRPRSFPSVATVEGAEHEQELGQRPQCQNPCGEGWDRSSLCR